MCVCVLCPLYANIMDLSSSTSSEITSFNYLISLRRRRYAHTHISNASPLMAHDETNGAEKILTQNFDKLAI